MTGPRARKSSGQLIGWRCRRRYRELAIKLRPRRLPRPDLWPAALNGMRLKPEVVPLASGRDRHLVNGFCDFVQGAIQVTIDLHPAASLCAGVSRIAERVDEVAFVEI